MFLSLQYLLSDHEVKVKTALWMAENSDYLKEQKGNVFNIGLHLLNIATSSGNA